MQDTSRENRNEKATVSMLSKIIAAILLRSGGNLTLSQKEIEKISNKHFTIDQDKNTFDLIFTLKDNL